MKLENFNKGKAAHCINMMHILKVNTIRQNTLDVINTNFIFIGISPCTFTV